MPWRLIGTIAILVVLLTFIGFNVENTCNLSLVFYTLENVPVYLTVFVSFILGLLFSLPFFFLGKKPKREKTLIPRETREKRSKNKKNASKEKGSETGEAVTEAPKESGPYGID